MLTDDWFNRKKHFIDGKHCVIFKDTKDLNEKLDYYLKNPLEAQAIALSGFEMVQKFNRFNWAKQIIEAYDKIK